MVPQRERVLFEPYGKPKHGSESANTIYLAIGQALSSWEVSEERLARLFAHIVNPNKLQVPVMRSYLLITSPKNRNELIKDTGKVFIEYFPNTSIKVKLKYIASSYEKGARRRNEIAHGVVAGHVGPKSGYGGMYLGPGAFSFKNRDNEQGPRYLYSDMELLKFYDDNIKFQWEISELFEAVSVAYRDGSEVARSRY